MFCPAAISVTKRDGCIVMLDEFVEYQLLQDDDIPSDVWDKASIVIDDDTTYHRMDIVWHHISTLKAPDSRL